ncbi:hypothetical protein PAMC26510_03395 [Caballeronia sordidicola]|uniref:Uncharacterized protein n=1 Tax=Caballeronia sordidicola TaxID=196367 RepID=A0A242N954_CABSO|nr:hypothetical protein PAMC26510_03395 [Caballeronia sordidicola]
MGDGALGSIKHTFSVEWVSVDRIARAQHICAARARSTMGPGEAEERRSVDARRTATGNATHACGSRLPRRTAKRHPALPGGLFHLGPEDPCRQLRRAGAP